jgi:hypothetical protein
VHRYTPKFCLLRQRFEQYPPERRALLLLTRSIRPTETQNFVANGNPRPLLRIDPAQTLGKNEVARKNWVPSVSSANRKLSGKVTNQAVQSW